MSQQPYTQVYDQPNGANQPYYATTPPPQQIPNQTFYNSPPPYQPYGSPVVGQPYAQTYNTGQPVQAVYVTSRRNRGMKTEGIICVIVLLIVFWPLAWIPCVMDDCYEWD
eukprot:TRINITY_DN483_c0_g4_i1.p1 TRINITY_DN483_c0_g4~~TRINITY_DN483_c0_g4_i1.p1  ORF type:complete len:126 (-),score=32.05 TRINITY_DN483_c0_g4_i1:104-433(-)